MTFLATPYDIPFLLASLKYHTEDPLVADNVTVRIYDGSGGKCLSQSEHKQYADLDGVTTTSHRDECHESHVAIRVPRYTKAPNLKNRAPRRGRLFGLSSMVLFTISFIVTALMARCVQRFLGVGQTQVEVDHAPAPTVRDGEPSANQDAEPVTTTVDTDKTSFKAANEGSA